VAAGAGIQPLIQRLCLSQIKSVHTTIMANRSRDTRRNLPNPADWGVAGTTQRLLDHWRHYKFNGPIPFFCQIEAVETFIWLTEVAPKRAASKGLLDQIGKANEEANPELFRLAMKMATGSGKTTVMAMLIAWQW
jgi:type III restriction enzyme